MAVTSTRKREKKYSNEKMDVRQYGPSKFTKNKRVEYDGTGYDLTSSSAREEKASARSSSNTAKRASTGATQSASSAAKKSNTTTKTASENRQAKADIALMKQTRQQNKNQKDIDEFNKEYDRLTKYTVRGNAQQRYKATKAREAYEKEFQSTHSNLDTNKIKKKKMTQVKGK